MYQEGLEVAGIFLGFGSLLSQYKDVNLRRA